MSTYADLLPSMTIEEKAALCSGITSWRTTPIKRLGIPSIYLSDGPHGVRREKADSGFGNVFAEALPATCFPPAVTLASTWDRELAYEVGQALGEECLELKVDVLLGPGVNIKRSPLCGRNVEYYGYPIKIAEHVALCDGTAFSARVSLDTIANIRKAKQAIKKAFQVQMDGLGFGFVEILATCPTNWKMTPEQAHERVRTQMMEVFKPGVYKDITQNN